MQKPLGIQKWDGPTERHGKVQSRVSATYKSNSSNYDWEKSRSQSDFLTYMRETGLSFSYGKVLNLIQLIDRVSKFNNSLSFGAKQNALRQIFLASGFFKDLLTKIAN